LWINDEHVGVTSPGRGGGGAESDVKGVAIPGGGTFEVLVSRGLDDLLKGAGGRGMKMVQKEACGILQKALLGLPLRLLQASNVQKRSASLVSLLQLTNDRAPHEVNRFRGGVNGRSGELLKPDTSVLEAVGSKVELLNDCLELIEQILRIDSLLSVTRTNR